jgi:hypothetical protein
MGETNSSLVAHVGYDISPLSTVELKNFKFNFLEWSNIVTHGQLKENLYDHVLDIIPSRSSSQTLYTEQHEIT